MYNKRLHVGSLLFTHPQLSNFAQFKKGKKPNSVNNEKSDSSKQTFFHYPVLEQGQTLQL